MTLEHLASASRTSPGSPGPEGDGRARLAWHYAHPLAQARRAHDAGVPVIGVTSDTVPWELIRAAGCFPLALPLHRGPSPNADDFLEPDVFAARIRGIFEGIVSGTCSFLRAVIIPRTSEQEYKLFLYLREVAREKSRPPMPEVCLFDLLHSRSEAAYEYGLGRTVRLREELERIAERAIGTEDLAQAIASSNSARAAVRRLRHLRTRRPRLSGTEAVTLTGAARYMDRQTFAELAMDAAEALERCPALPGVRIMIAGAQPEGAALHARLESLGALVTAEVDSWGAGADIDDAGDPLAAIFEKYYNDTPSPRVPADVADQWFGTSVSTDVDAVVFYLPPDDYVAGWDYPRHKRLLDARGIPSIVLRADAAALDERWLARLTALINGAPGRSRPVNGR
jgi:benzoyl-CoA reductase/2-hydroxyglutaryl-CoA dehydratase subunit BcrC/BadD/HgdB